MSATNAPKLHKITYLAEPGHGWALVPISAIMAYGIEHTISPYSYHEPVTGTAALEEDCDLTKFVKAVNKAGDRIEYTETHTNNDAHVRNWESFPRCEQATPEQVATFIEVDKAMDLYEQLDVLFTRYKDCFTGFYHNCLWKLMVDRTITDGTFMHSFEGDLQIALESGGYVPTGVRFVEPCHIHHAVILEDLNKTVFNQDYQEHQRVLCRSLAYVKKTRVAQL